MLVHKSVQRSPEVLVVTTLMEALITVFSTRFQYCVQLGALQYKRDIKVLKPVQKRATKGLENKFYEEQL